MYHRRLDAAQPGSDVRSGYFVRNRTRVQPMLVTLVGMALLALVLLAAMRAEDAPPSTDAVERRTLRTLAGLPQDGGVLGDPAAQMTLSVYTELTAFPFADFVADALPFLVERYVRAGRLKIQLRPLPSGEDALDEALVARFTQSVGMQDRMWQFASVFVIRYPGIVERSELEQIVRRSGASAGAAVASLDSPSVTDSLAYNERLLQRYRRIRPPRQPLYIVDPPVGAPREVDLPTEAKGLATTIDRLLRQ